MSPLNNKLSNVTIEDLNSNNPNLKKITVTYNNREYKFEYFAENSESNEKLKKTINNVNDVFNRRIVDVIKLSEVIARSGEEDFSIINKASGSTHVITDRGEKKVLTSYRRQLEALQGQVPLPGSYTKAQIKQDITIIDLFLGKFTKTLQVNKPGDLVLSSKTSKPNFSSKKTLKAPSTKTSPEESDTLIIKRIKKKLKFKNKNNSSTNSATVDSSSFIQKSTPKPLPKISKEKIDSRKANSTSQSEKDLSTLSTKSPLTSTSNLFQTSSPKSSKPLPEKPVVARSKKKPLPSLPEKTEKISATRQNQTYADKNVEEKKQFTDDLNKKLEKRSEV